MSDNEGNKAPEKTDRPTEDFFAAFGFSAKRGLYVPKSVINDEGPDRAKKRYRQRISRGVRAWLPYLTLLILTANTVIYGQQCEIMKGQSKTSDAQTTIMDQERQASNGADLGFMPIEIEPPCQLRWLITNNGNATAEHLEIFNGIKNLPQMSKLEFSELDSSKAITEIKQQSVNWAMLLKSHQREMNTMRANGVTEDKIEESDKQWRASLPGLPRRVTMELPRKGAIPYGATVCEYGVTDATTAPFVNVLRYSYEDSFGNHTGETCVSYFPGPRDKGLQPVSPCTEPVPTK